MSLRVSPNSVPRTAARSVALVDTETATRSPASVCAVGWAIVSNDADDGVWRVGESGQRLVRPPRNRYAKGNIAVHGITPQDTQDAPCFADAWAEAREVFLAADAECLAAYNASFDAATVWCSLNAARRPGSAAAARALLRGPDGDVWRIGCAMRSAAYALNPPGRVSLRAMCDWLGVELVDAHDAAADSVAAAQVLCAAANHVRRSPSRLFTLAWGSLWRFGRDGPVPDGRYTPNAEPAGVLAGVARDGRLLSS